MVRATFLNHYALNKYERANNSRFPFTNNSGARANA
jgi:hypothetical protein